MFHDAAVPSARHALNRAARYLDRIEATGQPVPLLTARLSRDMLNAAGQIATVASFALRATFPLTDRPLPEAQFPDDLRGLRGRLVWADAAVGELQPSDFAPALAGRKVRHRAGFAELDQDPAAYLFGFALPNLWFHLSTLHAILRQQGLAVGKGDFDGWHSYPPGFSWADPPTDDPATDARMGMRTGQRRPI